MQKILFFSIGSLIQYKTSTRKYYGLSLEMNPQMEHIYRNRFISNEHTFFRFHLPNEKRLH